MPPFFGSDTLPQHTRYCRTIKDYRHRPFQSAQSNLNDRKVEETLPRRRVLPLPSVKQVSLQQTSPVFFTYVGERVGEFYIRSIGPGCCERQSHSEGFSRSSDAKQPARPAEAGTWVSEFLTTVG